MKLMHSADWHIGKRLHGQSLIDDQAVILDQIVAIASVERPDLFIVAGDVYDRSIPPVEAVRLVDHTLRALRELGCLILLIPGNHDSNARLGFLSSALRADDIVIQSDFEQAVSPLSLTIDDVVVDLYSVPYCDPVLASAMVGEALVDHDAIYQWLDAQWQTAFDPSHINILVAHGYFGSASLTSESERPLAIGGSDLIDTKWLLPFDYVALGHLHRPQRLQVDYVRYAGSPLKYSFSEAADHKSICSVALGEHVDVRCIHLEPQRDVRVLTAPFDELLNQTPASEDYLSVVLTDRHAVYEPVKRLRQKFPNLLQLRFQHAADAAQSNSPEAAINSRQPEQLFGDFYQRVAGIALDSELNAAVQRALKQVMNGGEQ